MTDSDYLIKWSQWIEFIQDDVTQLLSDREIFRQYIEIVKANKEIQSPSDFYLWVKNNYVSAAVSSVRRQLDNDKRVISLMRLLIEIKANSKSLSRVWYKNKHQYNWADIDFTRIAGNGICFDGKIAQHDIDSLKILGKNIEGFANTYIAHRSKNPMDIVPTYKDLDRFIDELNTIIRKYILLFTGSGYTTLLPTWQYDWTTIFKQSWIKTKK